MRHIIVLKTLGLGFCPNTDKHSLPALRPDFPQQRGGWNRLPPLKDPFFLCLSSVVPVL